MTPTHDVVQKLLGAVSNEHWTVVGADMVARSGHRDDLTEWHERDNPNCPTCHLIAQTEAQLAGEVASRESGIGDSQTDLSLTGETQADPKAWVVEIADQWIQDFLKYGSTPQCLADRLDSAGLLASAPVVPSVGELERVIGQTDLRGPGMSHQYAQAIRNHLLTLGYKDNSNLLAAQAEVTRLREALKPFADAFEKHGKFIYDRIQGDAELIDINDQNQIHPRGTAMGDYRRAFEALAPKDPS